MLEVIIRSPGSVEVHEAVDVCSLRPGEVLLEVRRVGLCGSDYKLFRGTYGAPVAYPIRFGHEWSGVVLRTGTGSRFRRGIEVTGDCSKWCGECDRCRDDKNVCRRLEKFGLTIPGFSAQLQVVPEKYLYENAFGLDHMTLALTELFAVAFRGVLKVATLMNRGPILIVGSGTLGLATYMILSAEYDVTDIDIIETDPTKVGCARRLFPGARIEVVENGTTDGATSYTRTFSQNRYAVVFECSGHHEGLNYALRCADTLGTIVCFGLGTPGTITTSLLVTKSLRLLGSIGGTGAFVDAMNFLSKHDRAVRRLVTHHYPASESQAAFRDTSDDPRRLKVQIGFDE